MIQPADDLNLSAFIDVKVALGNRIHQHADHTIAGVGQFQEQFHIIVCLFKQSGQHIVQLVAGLNKQQAEGFVIGVLIFGLLNGIEFLAAEMQINIERIANDIRRETAGIGGQDSHAERKVVVDLHEANCNQSVEPSVCRLFDDLIKALLTDLFHQMSTASHIGAENTRFGTGQGFIDFKIRPSLNWISNLFFGNAIETCLRDGRFYQDFSRLNRKIPDCGFIDHVAFGAHSGLLKVYFSSGG